MSGIFNRLELDILQANELIESVELAIKHHFPAIVVHPGLASDALRTRGRFAGRFKIITPVDWPKGDNFGTLKFRGLSTDAIEADGFEVYLTGGKTAGDTKNEAKAITDFIKRHIGETTEVRFILGTFTRNEENILAMCDGLRGIQTPAYIRTDTQLKLQVSKANTEAHNEWVKKITDILKVPIKVSGNIISVRSITGCVGAQRFAVNLAQAKAIIREFYQQPDELKSILNTDDMTVNQTPITTIPESIMATIATKVQMPDCPIDNSAPKEGVSNDGASSM